MVTMLLDAGVDVNLANKTGITALMNASKKGYASVVKQLVDAGADIFAKNEVITCLFALYISSWSRMVKKQLI